MTNFNLLILIYCIITTVKNAQSLNYEQIVGGDTVGPGERTYNVYIKIGTMGSCGGAILGSKYVITAAHCLIDETGQKRSNSIKIVAGTNELLDSKAKGKVQIDVVKYYVFKDVFDEIHKLYSEISTDVKDIAILKLKTSLDTKNNQHISEVKLPGPLKYEKITATLTGYGAIGIKFDTKDPTMIFDGKLHKLDVSVSSRDNCLQQFLRHMHITNRNQFFCGDITKISAGSCKSDSGSPLVHGNNVLIGILAFGAPFCNVPEAMFVRISSYQDFIQKAMKDKPDKSMHCESLSTSDTCTIQ